MFNTNPYLPPYANSIIPQPVAPPVVPQVQPVQMPAPQMQIQTVSGGEESARAFQMGPNSSVILLDANNPLIWFVSTDSSGYKTVKPFTITPYEPEKPVSQDDIKDQFSVINSRLDKLEERMNANGQSNHGNAWRDKPVHANNNQNVRNVSGSQGSSGSTQPDGTD